MNDIDRQRIRKENRLGTFLILDTVAREFPKEIQAILDKVHITDEAYTKDAVRYTAYCKEFYPLTRGQPPIEYAALMDPKTKKFVKFKPKRDL